MEMMSKEKISYGVGLAVYVMAAVACAFLGNWAAFFAWSCGAILQGGMIAVRKYLQDIIDDLQQDRDWYKKYSEDTLAAAQDVNKLNDGILQTCQELSDSNKEYLNKLTNLYEVVKVMQSYLTAEELEAVNREAKNTGYHFKANEAGEYELYVNSDERVVSGV